MLQSSTGKLTKSQIKVQSFFFDASDPVVNFTDGDYSTNLVFRNNAVAILAGRKYEQDVSAYPAITIQTRVVNTIPNILLSDTLPFANVVDGYALGDSLNSIPSLPVAAAPGFANWEVININNAADGTVFVRLNGVTGSGITALSFMVFVVYIEFEF